MRSAELAAIDFGETFIINLVDMLFVLWTYGCRVIPICEICRNNEFPLIITLSWFIVCSLITCCCRVTDRQLSAPLAKAATKPQATVNTTYWQDLSSLLQENLSSYVLSSMKRAQGTLKNLTILCSVSSIDIPWV